MKKVMSAILFLIFGIITAECISVSAKTITITEPDGAQIVYTMSGDEVYQIHFNEKEELRIIGQHELSRAILTYQTVGFVFTMKPTKGEVSQFIQSGEKAFQIRFDDVTEKYVRDQTGDSVTISTYTFPADIMQKVFDYFKIDEFDERIHKIYISNVFRLIEYPNGREKPFIFSDEKVHYDRESIVLARAWTTITKQKLSHYYDMMISVQRSRTETNSPITPVEPDTPFNPEPESEAPKTPNQNTSSAPVIEKAVEGETGFRSDTYICKEAIPGGEIVEAFANVKKYRLHWNFRKVSGTKYYTVTVEKTYRSVSEEQEDIIRKEYVNVSRSYSYWEIVEFDLYELDRICLTNSALGIEEVSLFSPEKNSSVTCHRKASLQNHITEPGTYIILPSGQLTEEGSIPEEDIRSAAYGIDSIRVRNDTLIISGVTIMDGSYYSISAPKPTEAILLQMQKQNQYLSQKNLYLKNQISNGSYETEGSLFYIKCFSTLKESTRTYSLTGLAPISIHTPVVCSPKIECDNKQYVQLISPNHDAVPLVLDQCSELNDFILSISNYGMHRNQMGYQERDYGKTEGSVCYLEEIEGKVRNEVCFPFNVMIDIDNDEKSENDILLKQWSWYVLGNTKQRFYLPTDDVAEGIYIAKVRSVAANAGTNTASMIHANLSPEYSTAKEQIVFQISGRIYGLTINHITGTEWKDVFEDGFRFFTGRNDAYGIPEKENRSIFPLVDGSHPTIRNRGSIVTGTRVNYQLLTTGTVPHTGQVKINLRFLISGEYNQQEVDLYYMELSGDGKRKLRLLDSEMQARRSLNPGTHMQSWQGSFTYPLETIAVPKGTPVLQIAMESGIKQVMKNTIRNADIMVYFDINLMSGEEAVLSYENAKNASLGYNNMWRMEGAVQEKTDFYGIQHKFSYGAVFLLSTRHSLAEQSNIKILY